MGVAAAQIGFDHQARHRLRIGLWQPGGDECARHKFGELCCRDSGFICRHFLGPCALIHFQFIPNLAKAMMRRVTGAAPRQIIRSIEVMR